MYVDLDRPPLRPASLQLAVMRNSPWREVVVLGETSSTNAVVADAARHGDAEGLVVVAEMQTGGRGRLGRSWVSPPRAGLTFSMLFRPPVPPTRRGLLTLLVAAATARAVAERAEVNATVKWPNDVLVAERKVAGVLSEVVADAVVVGVGLNVSTRRDELAREDATSVALESNVPVDRGPLLLAVLQAVGEDYTSWLGTSGAPAAVLDRYRTLCSTLGRAVRLELPDGSQVSGRATAVDESGHLVVDGASYSAADVVHVR